MEKTGFVTRTAHPDDRRATLIRLTNKGEAVTGALAADQAEFSSYLSGTLSQVELDRMARTLDKLLDRLRARSYDDLRKSALDRWRARDRSHP